MHKQIKDFCIHFARLPQVSVWRGLLYVLKVELVGRVRGIGKALSQLPPAKPFTSALSKRKAQPREEHAEL